MLTASKGSISSTGTSRIYLCTELIRVMDRDWSHWHAPADHSTPIGCTSIINELIYLDHWTVCTPHEPLRLTTVLYVSVKLVYAVSLQIRFTTLF